MIETEVIHYLLYAIAQRQRVLIDRAVKNAYELLGEIPRFREDVYW